MIIGSAVATYNDTSRMKCVLQHIVNTVQILCLDVPLTSLLPLRHLEETEHLEYVFIALA